MQLIAIARTRPIDVEPPPVEAMVIEPEPLVTDIPVPAVSVALVNPVPFPMSSCPLVGVLVKPVPPLAIGNVPVTFVAASTKVVDVVPVPPLAIGSVPVTPVDSGNPVAFVSVALVGVPNIGVTNVGLVANTKAPVPVSSVTAAARLALDGVPKKVAIPVPNDVIPVPPEATPIGVDAVKVVNAPAAGVVPPIAMLFIVPAVAGFTVSVPVPVGEI